MTTSEETDIVIACCRDEEDIISAFIDFYLDMGFDTICLIDNGSRDSTVNKILQHPARDRISLFIDSRPGYDKRLIEYYQIFASRATRWCFFVDIDEFVILPGGIKAYALHIPAEATVLRLQTVEMLPPLDELDNTTIANPLLTYRQERQFQREHKVVWKRSALVHTIFCGKHRVDLEPYCEHHDDQVYIRHYHTRSRQQFYRKITNRIETEESFSEEERRKLSAFNPDVAQAWLEHSRQMIRPNGWELEKARIAAIPWVSDMTMMNWFMQNQQKIDFLNIDVSPVIPLRIAHGDWYCFCVRDYSIEEGHTAHEHLVLIHSKNNISEELPKTVFGEDEAVIVRIHSECLFGDVFESNRCDCGRQLSYAIKTIVDAGSGVLIYMRQEGRGIGLYNKIRSLNVDEPDSFIRNEMLGFDADRRHYSLAARILLRLGVSKARLMSGNPRKINALSSAGIQVNSDKCIVTEGISTEAYDDLLNKIRRGYSYSI